jgi:hypothetical protein
MSLRIGGNSTYLKVVMHTTLLVRLGFMNFIAEAVSKAVCRSFRSASYKTDPRPGHLPKTHLAAGPF